MNDYVCPSCGDVIGVLETDRFPLPPRLYTFCFECGEWVDFEMEE